MHEPQPGPHIARPPKHVPVDPRVQVAKPIVKPPDPVVEAPPQPPPPPPPPMNDVDAFTKEFQAVGTALKTAARTRDVADLQGRYNRITFSKAVSTQQLRDDARQILAGIRHDLSR